MDRLWSPWRLKYVTGGEASSQCVFCAAGVQNSAAPASPGQDALVVARGQFAFVILNLYPYNNGHLMVVPVRHFRDLASATDVELVEMMRLIRDAEVALQESYQPNGINVGINLGQSAGAGIADHLHVHLVPRWTGDTNFMTVVGATRVLPETLEQTAAKLRPVFQRLTRDRV